MAESMETSRITLSIPSPWMDVYKKYRDSEIASHIRGIRREMLLAIRSVIDARIECLSEADEGAGKQKPKKVDVK